MPLHPQLAPLAASMHDNPDAKPMSESTVEEARAGYSALGALFGPGEEVASVLDRTLPGPAGPVPVRVYTPSEGGAPKPLLVFFHGGGWVIGDLDSHDRECRALSLRADCIVVSVHYRRAPEAPFPAAIDDSWAALNWVAQHGGELGGDPTRLAIAGDSAGGNIAAVLALMARDAGGPALCFQLLVYPAVDFGMRDAYPSLIENKDGPFLTLDTMDWFEAHYLSGLVEGAGSREALGEAELRDPRLSPIHASSHADLPATLLVTAEFDPLRDGGRAYVKKLEAAGVDTRHHEFDGMAHLFFQLSAISDDARALLDECGDALRQAFAQR